MQVNQKPPTAIPLESLLTYDHCLNGGILFGLDGYTIELQARAMRIDEEPRFPQDVTSVTGMPKGALREAMSRIAGAFSKLGIPKSHVSEILVNLVPPDLPKDGTWLDLPLAIIILQAAGILPPLPEHQQGDFLLFGELDIHGAIRRVPGALSLAFCAKPGQNLIVPAGNDKECALILAKPGHDKCRILPVSLLEDVIAFFRGQRKLDHVLKQGAIRFEDAIPRSPDFGLIRGQEKAKVCWFSPIWKNRLVELAS